jgi:hypothetical protein
MLEMNRVFQQTQHKIPPPGEETVKGRKIDGLDRHCMGIGFEPCLLPGRSGSQSDSITRSSVPTSEKNVPITMESFCSSSRLTRMENRLDGGKLGQDSGE